VRSRVGIFNLVWSASLLLFSCSESPGPGTSVFVVEREGGKIAVVDYVDRKLETEFSITGNLRHASMVFDPAMRYAYLISRDGILSKIDVYRRREVDSLKVSENSIAIAISQNGGVIAAANYKPGGITFIDTESFKIIQKISAEVNLNGEEIVSRVTGLVDAPGNLFVCSLMDADEIWVIGPSPEGSGEKKFIVQRKIKTSEKNPFDALITSDGRYYMAGHFKQQTSSLVDLWSLSDQARSITFRRDAKKDRIPVKMPHMEGWAVADGKILIPVTSDMRLYAISTVDFSSSGHTELIGEPVYAVVRPDRREVWVTFSGDKNDGKIQIVDPVAMKSLKVLDVGKRIYHLVFTPRGDRAIVSSNESNEVVILDAVSHEITGRVPVASPSGIFGIWRAFQIGL